jgi:hypothetical protein
MSFRLGCSRKIPAAEEPCRTEAVSELAIKASRKREG